MHANKNARQRSQARMTGTITEGKNMTTYRFTINGRLPGLNEIIRACRQNKYLAAKQKADTEKIIMLAANRLKNKKFEKVKIHICWHEPNKRRDKDNIRAGIKFILDALTAIQVIQNDNWRVIEDLEDSFCVDSKNPKVIVDITDLSTNLL